jgi:type I restriction enzyme S subunit
VHYQEGKFALANLLVALLPKDPSVCDAKYLYHLLMARKDELLVPLMLGTANVSLKEKDIAGVSVQLPPLPEQRRIVAQIEQLAVLIREARALRHQATAEADALFEQARARTFELAAKGGVQALAEAATLERGKFSHRPRNDRRFFGGDHPWIQIGEI